MFASHRHERPAVVPPIDLQQPSETRTATFALG